MALHYHASRYLIPLCAAIICQHAHADETTTESPYATASDAPSDATANKWAVGINYSGHTSLTRDDLGDRKYGSINFGRALSKNRWLAVEARAALETPENGTENIVPGQLIRGIPSNQRDTGSSMLAAGISSDPADINRWGLSGRLGQINGVTTDGLQGFFRWEHSLEGNHLRTSPASTRGQLLIGATAFGEHQLVARSLGEIKYVGNILTNLNAVACATAGTDKGYLAAGATLTIGLGSQAIRPQLCESPYLQWSDTGLLIGAYAKSVFFDVTTNGVGTQVFQPYMEVQYHQKIMTNFLFSLGISDPLTTTVVGATQSEIMNYHAGIAIAI